MFIYMEKMELKGVSKFINILSLEVTKSEFKSRSVYFKPKNFPFVLYSLPQGKREYLHFKETSLERACNENGEISASLPELEN